VRNCGRIQFGAGLPVEKTIVTRLNEFQRYRGPDGEEGVWASDDQRVVLGHRRLASIETGRLGDQPMREVSHRWVITFNGEIYNHAELRAELETLGCNFATRSDTHQRSRSGGARRVPLGCAESTHLRFVALAGNCREGSS
jgi:asparagine synthase (glutamine-hydrolysing)